MKPTQKDIIDLAREAGVDTYPEWLHGIPTVALERLVHLALERFGAGGGEPVAWLNPYGGVVQVRATGHEKEHFTIPLYTRPSPSELRAEYLRWLEDAKKVCLEQEELRDHTPFDCIEAIEALKGKQ